MTTGRTTSTDWTRAVRRTVLPNGLTVLIEPNRSAPVVASVAHVRAGYFDEPDEWVGIAHVLEHMFFKGTSRRPPGVIAQETQRLGGYLNAGTIYDKTVYYSVLPAAPDAVEGVVDLQADALMNASIDEGELARELEVIIQEANRKLDSPGAVAVETLFALLYRQHRIRRWRIGTEDGLRRLTADDVRAYYRSRYVPERTIVALVGDLDPDAALELVRRYYGGWRPSTETVSGSPEETDPPGAALRIVTGDVHRPCFALGWRTVGALHDDAVPLDVAAAVLGSGRGSWLSRAIRVPGLGNSARAHHYTPTEVGVFDLTLEAAPEQMSAAVCTALGLVERLAERGPTPADLERVRSLLQVGWCRRLEDMDSRASLFCQFEALGGFELLNQMYDATVSATPDEVRRVARRYLIPELVSGAAYVAAPGDAGVKPDLWAPRPAAVNLGPVPTGLLPDVSGRRPAPRERTGDVLHATAGGVDLLVRPKPGTGLAHLALYCPRLRELETADTAGFSALVVRSALRRTTGLDGEQLASAAERLGGTVTPAMLAGGVGWALTVRADALRQAAGLLAHLATEAAPRDDDLATECQLQAGDAQRAEDDMYNYPIRRVLGLAHPDSPHGLSLLGEPDRVADAAPDAVRDWMACFRSRRLAIVAVGDMEADRLMDALNVFESWPGRECDVPSDIMPWAPSRDVLERDKAQTALAMAFPGRPYGRDRVEMMVMGSLLSGLAGRLFGQLREKRALAYSVSATPWQRHTSGAILTYIATSPEREQEARMAMLEELVRVASSTIPRDELERAARYVAGSIQLRRQSSPSLAAEVYEAWNRGDLNGLPSEIDRVGAVGEGDLKMLAERMFGPELRAEFVLRGRGGPAT